VGNYGAIDAFPHPDYAPTAGTQEDDALARKMAELMQNQFGLKPKCRDLPTSRRSHSGTSTCSFRQG
jgi:hypothetical protein